MGLDDRAGSIVRIGSQKYGYRASGQLEPTLIEHDVISKRLRRRNPAVSSFCGSSICGYSEAVKR